MNQDDLDDGILEYHPKDKRTYEGALAPISQGSDSNEQEDYYEDQQYGEELFQPENTTNIYQNNTQRQYQGMTSMEDENPMQM